MNSKTPAPRDRRLHASPNAKHQNTSSASETKGDTLLIPDIRADDDNLTAALKYAADGWYVIPVRAGTKDAGSVVGRGWPAQSSRDPKIITAWFAGTDYGIALHCGRSGAVVIDVDNFDKAPDEILRAVEAGCPHQSSRPDQPHRGHYLFANTTGRRVGNSVGKLGRGWGDVRGANGVIVVAPTPHPGGGLYQWKRTGALPALPDYIADALPESHDAEATATDAEVEAFLDRHVEATRPEALVGLVNTLKAKLASGASCHASTLGVLTDAMAEAAAGLYGARTAARELYEPFRDTATTGTSTGRTLTRAEAKDEYRGILSWAVGQVDDAGIAKARERVASQYDHVVEADAEALAPPPLPDDFWNSRPVLRHIRQFAHARLVSPMAVLGESLARVVANTPPNVVLPPLVGGRGSLNLFVDLAGPPGHGKDAAGAVARDAFEWAQAAPVVPVGSGEGIPRTFRPVGADPEGPNPVTAAIFSISELDTWSALAARTGSTLTATLRAVFGGATIGFANAGKDTRTIVPEHSYRASLVAYVQPERAGALLSAADGGFPQRFLWLWTGDPDVPDECPPAPKALPDPSPAWVAVDDVDYVGDQIQLCVPDIARDEIIARRRAVLRGDAGVDPLDGHSMFVRLKVAAALMLLDSRTAMTAEDWALAGQLMAASAATRRACQRAVAAQFRRSNRARAQAAAEREEVGSDRRFQRCQETLLRALDKAGGGLIARRDLRQKLRSDIRAEFGAVIAQLIEDGRVTEVKSERGTAYTTRPPRPPLSTATGLRKYPENNGGRASTVTSTVGVPETRDLGKCAETSTNGHAARNQPSSPASAASTPASKLTQPDPARQCVDCGAPLKSAHLRCGPCRQRYLDSPRTGTAATR